MARFISLALLITVAIGCSKGKPKRLETDEQNRSQKPPEVTRPSPAGEKVKGSASSSVSTLLPKIEQPDPLPKGMPAEIRKTFASLKAEVSYSDLGHYLSITFRQVSIPPGTLKKLAPYAKYLRGLDLMGCEVSDDELASLPDLPWLQFFSLHASRGFTDAGFAKLPSTPRLANLKLAATPITDVGLARFAQQTSLTYVDLNYTAVTDAGLKHLSLHTKMFTLWLESTAVTDSGLKHLSSMANLNSIYLKKTKVTGTGFKELAGLRNLACLNLEETPLTDVGLASLPELPKLAFVRMNGAEVTDSGLKALVQRNHGIVSIEFQSTKITDAGATALLSLPKLQTVFLKGSRVTNAGVNAIKAKFPNCFVDGP